MAPIDRHIKTATFAGTSATSIGLSLHFFLRVQDTVNFPVHLKNFNLSQLRQLCKELRSDIVHTVSKTGGTSLMMYCPAALINALHTDMHAVHVTTPYPSLILAHAGPLRRSLGGISRRGGVDSCLALRLQHS